MRILTLKKDLVIYRTDEGATIAQPITQAARAVLNWHRRNTPAND